MVDQQYVTKNLRQNSTIIFVIIFIFFVYFVYILTIAIPFEWFSFTELIGTFQNLILHIFLFMIIINYLLASYTNPGEIPKGWIPENATEEEIQSAKDSSEDIHSTKRVIWCSQCEQFKPKRSHHCRRCNRCILKMDHHCMWTENCVGHNNHKFFFLFLLYASIGLINGLILFFIRLFQMGYFGEENFLHKFLLYIQFVITFPITLGINYLLLIQFYVIKRNTTSVETSIRRWQEFDARKANQTDYRWSYDYGTIQNFQEVLGSSFLLWFVPTPPENDGINWKMVLKSQIV